MPISTTPYSPTYDFAGDPEPANKVNAGALQAEFARISAWGADLSEALAAIVRDDDTLVDELVRIRNIHPELWSYILTQIEGNVQTQALNWLVPVLACATTNVAVLAGAQAVDGVTLASGNRVLLVNQTDPAQNGVWSVGVVGDAGNAPGLWLRPSDMASGAIVSGGFGIMVRTGTVNGNTAYALAAGSAELLIVDTNILRFMSVVGPYPLTVAKGGTGASTAAAARVALGMPGKAVAAITGDGLTAAFSVGHGLNTRDVLVSVRDALSPRTHVGVEIRCDSLAQIDVVFSSPPAALSQYVITVIG